MQLSGETARYELTHRICIVCKKLNIAFGAERKKYSMYCIRLFKFFQRTVLSSERNSCN